MPEQNPPGALPSSNDNARLSKAELAVQAATSEARIDECVARGLISGPDGRGTYDRGNATRLRLIAGLEQSGIALSTLARAATERGLTFDFADRVIADP